MAEARRLSEHKSSTVALLQLLTAADDTSRRLRRDNELVDFGVVKGRAELIGARPPLPPEWPLGSNALRCGEFGDPRAEKVTCGWQVRDAGMCGVVSAEVNEGERHCFQAMIDNDFDILDQLLGKSDLHQLQRPIRHPHRSALRKLVQSRTSQVDGATVVVTGHVKMDVNSEGNRKLLKSRYA